MNLGSLPAKIAAIFAASGIKNNIPLTASGAPNSNNASYESGFPKNTMVPVPSGGLPPYGADFNGILNAITQLSNWQSAGGIFPYDAAFATQVGGYPKGALLLKSQGFGLWQSIVDANTTNPDTGGAGWSDVVLLSTVNSSTDPSYTNNTNNPASTNWVVGKTQPATTINDPGFTSSGVTPASTGWVRGAMNSIFFYAGFAIQLGQNGYIRLPSFMGGLTIQWGIAPSSVVGNGATNYAVFNFPIPYTTACYSVVSNFVTPQGACSIGCDPASWNTNQAALAYANLSGVTRTLQGTYISIGK